MSPQRLRLACPRCGGRDDSVVDTRANDAGIYIRRRRECGSCGHRFSTVEILADELDQVRTAANGAIAALQRIGYASGADHNDGRLRS